MVGSAIWTWLRNLMFGDERDDVGDERADGSGYEALLADPSVVPGHLFLPREDYVDEVGEMYGGVVVFATTDFEDQWLVRRQDGTWVEVQREDGEMDTFPSWRHVAADLCIRVFEDADPDTDLAAVAQVLNLNNPAGAEQALEALDGDREKQMAALLG